MSKVITDENKIKEALSRRVEENGIFPSRDYVVEKLKEGKELRFYLGIDPTEKDLHLGHTIPLLLLKQLLEIGHKIILLIGDFTARIGDPTDKEVTRKALTKKDVEENMKTYLGQVSKILPKGSFKLEYNSKWLSKMTFEEVIKLTSHVTVQQMLARDMFRKRMDEQKPIHMHEFLYPLMQGYDSVAMEVDGEVGGNDQTFNMLVGRDLEKAYLGKDKIVIATRLLIDAQSGKKMSKSEGGLIAINDSPEVIYEKVMRHIPDEMTKVTFELATERDIEQIKDKHNPKKFKEELASELVKMYHGEEAVEKAKNRYDAVAKKETPEEIQEFKVSVVGDILSVMIASGLAKSSSEARRLIDQKGVSVNGKTVENWDEKVRSGDVIKVGPRKFVKIVK